MAYVGRVPSTVPVTADDIPANSIDASKIIDGSIELAEIADNSITDAKLNSSKLDGIEALATADQTKADIEGLGIAASSITGALPAIDGSALTGVASDDASALTSGTLPTARLPAGSVLQVVHNGTTVGVTNNSQTFANTGLESVITPISTSSKILIIISQSIHKGGNGQIDQMQLNITRNGTQLVQWTAEVLHDNGGLGHFDIYASQTYLDSPSSTSALTYRTQFRRRLNTGATMQVQYAGSRSSITLMEVAQ